MTPAVIIGAVDDPHVNSVVELLSQEPLVFDAESIGRTKFALLGEQLIIETAIGRHALKPGSPTRGWLRRVAPQHWHAGVVAESREFAEMTSWLALLAATVRGGYARWLTALDAAVRADNKLVVQAAAARARVRTPWTAVTNDPQYLTGNGRDTVVVKPLGPGHFEDSAGAHNVFAATVTLDMLTRASLAPAPFLIQEHLNAVQHRRVVTVGNRVWSASLDADGLPLDWRREPAAHHAFRVERTPDHVADAAVAIARELELGYSSQDWVETHTAEHVLLDVNPAGQWLFLPGEIAAPVTRAIARWLEDDTQLG